MVQASIANIENRDPSTRRDVGLAYDQRSLNNEYTIPFMPREALRIRDHFFDRKARMNYTQEECGIVLAAAVSETIEALAADGISRDAVRREITNWWKRVDAQR